MRCFRCLKPPHGSSLILQCSMYVFRVCQHVPLTTVPPTAWTQNDESGIMRGTERRTERLWRYIRREHIPMFTKVHAISHLAANNRQNVSVCETRTTQEAVSFRQLHLLCLRMIGKTIVPSSPRAGGERIN